MLLTLFPITIHLYLVLWISQIGLEFLFELPLPIPFRLQLFIYLNSFSLVVGPRQAVRRSFFGNRDFGIYVIAYHEASYHGGTCSVQYQLLLPMIRRAED